MGVVSVLGLEPTHVLVQGSAMHILSARHLEASVQTTSSVSVGAHSLPLVQGERSYAERRVVFYFIPLIVMED